MEFSENIDTEPIGRKQRDRYRAAHVVLSFLTEKYPIHEGDLYRCAELLPEVDTEIDLP